MLFGIGIARAWQLLGLKGGGLLDELGTTLAPRAGREPADDPPAGDDGGTG